MFGLFTGKKDLEERVFKKAVAAKKPTFMQGIMGTGDYNKYISYVKKEQKRQNDLEKEEFKRKYDLEEQKLDVDIAGKRNNFNKKYGVDALRQESRKAQSTEEKINIKKQISSAEQQVESELRFFTDQMKQLKKQRKKEETDMRFRHKKSLEQAEKEARQRLDEARNR